MFLCVTFRGSPFIHYVPDCSLLCVYNDNRDSFSKSTPSPSLWYSLIHAHRSIGYCNIPQPLTDSAVRLIYLRVDDNHASSSKSVPSPLSLCYSLTHAHRFIGYHNIPQSLTDSVSRLIYLCVYDSRSSSSKPSPSPSSLCYSLTHAHNIHIPTLPTPTLLTFTCTQVLWFLSRLTRPRASGVTTRPDTRITIISTQATQCMRGV